MDDLTHLLNRGYRYAVSLTHNQDVAKDLVQEACVQIHKKGGPWNVGYLFKAIKNKYIDQYRRSKKVVFEPLEYHDAKEGLDDIKPNQIDMELMLSKLKDEEREVIYLSVIEGFTTKEISQLIDKPQGTILSLIHRGKERLKTFIIKSGKVES